MALSRAQSLCVDLRAERHRVLQRRCRAGRANVIEHYYRELLGFLSRRVADKGTAADLAQESYARLYAARASGTVVENPRALLYRTARNLVIDQHRHDAVRAAVEMPVPSGQSLPDAPAPRGSEPEAAVASRQVMAAVVETIEALPPRCREAFVLSRFEGLSHADVARRMGVSTKMVEQHIKLALTACAKCRARQAGEDGAA